MIVVEFGCGANPGPYLEGADAHYIYDSNPALLELAARNHPDFTPLEVADGKAGLEEESVDIFLTRNVFSDAVLGVGNSKKTSTHARAMFDPLRPTDDLKDYFKEVDNDVFERKVNILHEAFRLLFPGGKFIAVEQHTPDVARKFFSRIKAEESSHKGLPAIVETPIDLAAPANYAKVHNHPDGAIAFTAIKHI